MENTAASRIVLGTYSERLVADAARQTLRDIGGRVSCAIVFVTSDWEPHLEDFLELVQVHGHVPMIIGGSASGLIGTNTEIEGGSGFSLLFLHLPETKLTPLVIDEAGEWPRVSTRPDAWIVLAHPGELALDDWLTDWNEAFPGIPCLGGLASGGSTVEDIFLFRDHQRLRAGGVALGLSGGVRVVPVVSQGCKPIGEPLTITGVDENMLQSVGSRPAYAVLESAFQTLTDEERARSRGNLFVGLATSEYLEEFHRGDFLIRQILAADSDSGAVMVGGLPRVGQTLQYQLRDPRTSHEDLRERAAAIRAGGARPFAMIVFSCLGRGRQFFSVENHDAGVLASTFGPVPATGFFGHGELGPVGGKNFIHTFAASAALLVDA